VIDFWPVIVVLRFPGKGSNGLGREQRRVGAITVSGW